MRPAIIATVLAISLVGLGYVRREWRPASTSVHLVVGSRDRTLHGKARRLARRTNHG